MRHAVWFALTLSTSFFAGCSSSDSATLASSDAGPAVSTVDASLPPLLSAQTTLDSTLVLAHAVEEHVHGNPSLPQNLPYYLDGHYGELTVGPAEPCRARMPEGTDAPAPGPSPRLLVRFAHLSDMQIADDESPVRMGSFDSYGASGGALRPQDSHLCRLTNAAVRTINGLHRQSPLSFVLLGGDNIDNAQSNELDWLLGILKGGVTVECDSGNDDDIVSGPNNDGKDPFVSEGLAVPWKWMSGNHDVLVQGNFNASTKTAEATGSVAEFGTRDYAKGGQIVSGTVVADSRRSLLDRSSLMKSVSADGDGHGLDSLTVSSGRAFYVFDIPSTPLRFVVLDTATELGGADGVLRRTELDSFVRPSLDAAQKDGKSVILASHHSSLSLTTDGGLLGVKVDGAVSAAEWISFIGSYDNILYALAAHSHVNTVRPLPRKSGPPIWEITTTSIADFPHQFRLIEIYDQDNGWLMLRATLANIDVAEDPIAEYGRKLGAIDFTSGWNSDDGRGVGPDARNVELWAKRP